MQTNFTAEQLENPHVRESEQILRKCVHCGFCLATCPTYVTLGNELDSPRGRIYLIKDMLENDRPADEEVVTHIDRCLSCLSCMTTCPSGVHYMHLVDHARAHIERTYRRPLADRLIRAMLAMVLPYPRRFRMALHAARLGRPFAPLFGAVRPLRPLAAMLRLAPAGSLPLSQSAAPTTHRADGAQSRGRVAILTGCAQPVLAPEINEAAIRLLTRTGTEVIVPEGEGCCGALVHHMGREGEALAAARRNVDVWSREIDRGLDAIVITTSGCGTTIKDYGYMLRLDPDYAEKAKRVSERAMDITEYLATLDLPPVRAPERLAVAYHSACSMQHGQRITRQPKELLSAAGFEVRDPPEGHLCCGSAGSYNITQPEIAAQLRDRKIANIESTRPDVIATGNIGCITQIAGGTAIPIIHTIALLDWAYGGKKPAALPDARSG